MTDTWGLVGPVPWTDELPVLVMIWTSYQEINDDSKLPRLTKYFAF